ncbi:hypothetical protein FRC07_015028 [Ceratobasidium sp. 392]|nr:hypothetical protein FRC07_015028 [Ceratobasidium sp. 392]
MTDKPVFPGVTTSILSSLLANIRFNSVPNPFKDEKITASIRSYPDLLSAIVFAFSCAVILLLARTIASWVIRRTGKNSEHRGCTHEALDQVQGRVHVMEQGEKKFPPPS